MSYRRGAMIPAAALCQLVAGCGRIGFDARTTHDGAVDDDGFTGGGQASHVQTIAPDYVTTTSLAAMITVEAGHTLVAATYWDTTPNTITVSDSSGLTWTPLAKLDHAACYSAPKSTGAQLWFAQIATSEIVTVTVTQSDTRGRPLGMRLLEYTGLAGYVAAAATVAPSASNTMSAGPFTTTVPSLTVALFANTNGSGTMLAGSGWSERSVEVPFYILVEDNAPGAPAGDIDASAALPSGVVEDCWVATAVAFELR